MIFWAAVESTDQRVASVVGTPARAKPDVKPWTSLEKSDRSKFAVLHADRTAKSALRFSAAIQIQDTWQHKKAVIKNIRDNPYINSR